MFLWQVEAEFEEQWADGKVEEWETAIRDSEHVQDQQAVIDLDYFITVEELVELGAEKLKEALASLGLKMGVPFSNVHKGFYLPRTLVWKSWTRNILLVMELQIELSC